jgi:hypothetical protein
MKLHTCARGLLAGAMSVMALAGGTGVARADDPIPAPAPSIIDQLLTQTPVLFVDPADEGGPASDSNGVGMYCENLLLAAGRRSETSHQFLPLALIRAIGL